MSESKYKLGILDEYQSDVDDFHVFFENDFITEAIELSENEDEIINNILEASGFVDYYIIHLSIFYPNYLLDNLSSMLFHCQKHFVR